MRPNALIDTATFAATMRDKIIRPASREVLVARIAGSEQEQDLTLPPNCGGLGRIRHFKRSVLPGWRDNPLPIDPAAKALRLPTTDILTAQVFQNAACAWRCWYCYVPFNLLSGDISRGEWKTATELVTLYAEQKQPPRVIDLSGGSPDLTPEWIIWMMKALTDARLADSTYLWSDDNLSTDYLFNKLDESERRRLVDYKNYGRVCCIKGFDADSFAFNTTADPSGYDYQFEILRRYVDLGIDVYGYVTLNGNYELDPQKRYLQAEARAHISVQQWIDGGGLSDQPIVAAQSLMKIHDRFFSEFPEAQWVEDAESKKRACVIPGQYRQHKAKIGLHEPPSPGSITRFMARFEENYKRTTNPEEAILAVAAAHHRLLWIHPFGDGNGRVARLMSDGMLSRTLHTHSLWSVSRGLARSVVRYKHLLVACDLGRRNDLDGRGNLSEETLAEFTAFFLETCIEQVRFMRRQMRLDELQEHIDRWLETSAAFEERGTTEGKHMPRQHPAAGRILKAVLDVGALTVSEGRQVLGTEVDADGVIRQLTQAGVLRRRGENLTFWFPANLAGRFLPGLFP
jgi:Fic family protein